MEKMKRVLRQNAIMSRVIAALLFLSFAGSRVMGEGSDRDAADVVRSYLSAWERGGYAAMYPLLDSATRRKMTSDQFKAAFLISTREQGKNQEERSDGKTQPQTLVAGRPSKIIGFQVHLTTSVKGFADCTAEFSAGSENGIDALFVSPELWKQAEDKSGKDGVRPLLLALATQAVLKPTAFSTSKGQYKHILSPNKSPLITLHFRRLTLVKEDNHWHIANAVSVQKSGKAE